MSSLRRGLIKPKGLERVPYDSLPPLIAETQTASRFGQLGGSGPGIPFHGNAEIPHYAPTLLIAATQIVLGRGISGAGGLLIAGNRANSICFGADPPLMAYAQSELRALVSPLGGQGEQAKGTLLIRGDSVSPVVGFAQLVESLHAPLTEGIAVPCQRAGGMRMNSLFPVALGEQPSQSHGGQGHCKAPRGRRGIHGLNLPIQPRVLGQSHRRYAASGKAPCGHMIQSTLRKLLPICLRTGA